MINAPVPRRYVSPLRVQRVIAGLSQEELGKAIRRSQPYVSRIENGGTARVSRRLAARIAGCLGVPVSVIFPDLPPVLNRRRST